MAQETIHVGKQEHLIEVKPLTIVCKSPNLIDEIEYPKRFPITADMTIYHAERCENWHVETWDCFFRLFKTAFQQIDEQTKQDFIRNIRSKGKEFLHGVGLIDMSLKLIDMGVPIVWKYPETYLHPAVCCELGDLSIYLAQRGRPDETREDDVKGT